MSVRASLRYRSDGEASQVKSCYLEIIPQAPEQRFCKLEPFLIVVEAGRIQLQEDLCLPADTGSGLEEDMAGGRRGTRRPQERRRNSQFDSAWPPVLRERDSPDRHP